MDALLRKYALMAFIQCMALAGSPEKSAGRAALSLGVAEDMGVVDGVEGVTGGLGGKACCWWGLGLLKGAVGFQGNTEVTVEVEGRGGGEGDLSSSSLELSKSSKAPGLRGDNMLGVSPTPK